MNPVPFTMLLPRRSILPCQCRTRWHPMIPRSASILAWWITTPSVSSKLFIYSHLDSLSLSSLSSLSLSLFCSFFLSLSLSPSLFLFVWPPQPGKTTWKRNMEITLRKLTMSLSMTTRGLSIKWTTPLLTGMLALTTWVTTTPRGWW